MNTKLVIGAVAVAAVAIVGGSILLGGVGAPAEPTPTPTPEPPPAVTAKGNLQPIREARLGFRTLGAIAVMPKVGDRFEAGQEIARLDTTELDLTIEQAEDAVAVARASLEQVAAPVRAEDLAAAEAAHQGAVARHNGLLAGASSAEVRTAEVAVAAAEASLAAAKQRLEALDPNDEIGRAHV